MTMDKFPSTSCAREALRLHPVVPFNVPHVSSTDTVVAGYFIPKGSNVLLSRVALGRNAAVWRDRLRFDPDRHFAAGERVELAEPELRFVTFTAGRRGCVGGEIGMNVTVMMLGRLIQGFKWEVAKGMNKIDLSEESNSLYKAVPLCAHAQPRLYLSVYECISR